MMMGSAQAVILAGDSVSIDFNTATDVDDFLDIRDDTPSDASIGSSHNAIGGTGATKGAISAVNVGTTNGSNDFATFYAPGGLNGGTGTIKLNTGDILNMSVDFFTTHVDEAATPRFGIVSLDDLNTFTTNGTVFDINNGKDTIGGTNISDGLSMNLATGGDKTFNIVNTFEGAARVFDTDPDGPFTLADATWYQFDFTLIKTATADEFDVTITLNQLNADGSFSSQIGTHNAIITNADLYTESGGNGVLAGFTFVHDGEPDTVTNEYDNLHITITVPEPSSAALLGLGGLALIMRRRK